MTRTGTCTLSAVHIHTALFHNQIALGSTSYMCTGTFHNQAALGSTSYMCKIQLEA